MGNLSWDDIGARQFVVFSFSKRGNNTTRAMLMRTFAIILVLSPESAFAQAEHLTLKSWTACPTIEATNQMLFIDGSSSVCEQIKANSRMIVERNEQAPATRWLCIDHPAARGIFTLCNWQTFQDEPKTWLCARSANAIGPCKWGPAEYFSGEPVVAEVP
jgi:hypothetical protein